MLRPLAVVRVERDERDVVGAPVSDRADVAMSDPEVLIVASMFAGDMFLSSALMISSLNAIDDLG